MTCDSNHVPCKNEPSVETIIRNGVVGEQNNLQEEECGQKAECLDVVLEIQTVELVRKSTALLALLLLCWQKFSHDAVERQGIQGRS